MSRLLRACATKTYSLILTLTLTLRLPFGIFFLQTSVLFWPTASRTKTYTIKTFVDIFSDSLFTVADRQTTTSHKFL